MGLNLKTLPITESEFHRLLPFLKSRYKAKLFPNTPIEIVVDFTPTDSNGKKYHYCLNCEGQWIISIYDPNELEISIDDIIRSNSKDLNLWTTESTRSHPEWDGWSRINLAGMCRLLGEDVSEEEGCD